MCKFHHNGPALQKCAELKKVRHLTRYCCEAYWLLASKDIIAKMWGFRGHYRSDCPKLKNQNHRNQAEGTEACGMVKANVVTDALSRKEWIKPLRVQALIMISGLDLPKRILNAQTRARKPKNLKYKNVLAKVGAIAYKLELPQELSRVHNMFHVSNLKKCHADEPLAVPLDGLHIDDKLYFVEESVEIIDQKVKRLRQSRVPIVKVRWNSRRGPEYTWERKDQFWREYPHLFTKTASSSSAAS
ncbi:hypothetical protein Tco_1165125 [Tanacetum coccineum]